MKRIGDILTRNKTRVTVEDGVSYKQVTIRTNYKGVVLRGVLDGATIGTKEQFRVSVGQFILSRIDARNGAFGIIPDELEGAIVTNDFLAFDINENEVETEFFNVFLQSPIFLEACIRASRGNTNRKRVDENFFLNYEVNLPSLPDQHQLIKRINKARAGIVTAQDEITRQKSLLAKLKQAILQEAIQGKLTADWRAANPDVGPASQLMQRIQAEKARLIAAKKIRPEKPLSKITPNEVPFEIPKGWEWTRLGGVCKKTGSGSTPSGGKTAYSTMGIPFLRSQNVHDDGLVLDDVAFISTAIHARMKGTAVYPQDILLNITGGSIGRCALVSDEIEEANINQHVAIIRPLIRTSGSFLHAIILSPYFQNKVDEAQTGAGREGLPKNKMDRILIPLPPLAEQVAIVEKVEALMTTCRTLEAEIEHARTHAAHLLQAVLREAFSGELVAQQAQDKPAPAASNVIPFPVRIGNISATDLHAGILAKAYQLHAQNPKHLIYFGHVKAEKIAHLVEAHLGIDLKRMPVKAALGPNDFPHLKKVESRAKKANWFVVRQQQADGAYVFHKEHGFDALLGKTAEALGERAAEVDALIRLLLPLNTRQAEIVATLYAAWNNLLLLGRSSSDEEIVYEARENWHASKLGIEREKFFKGLEWMRKQGLVPVGRGKYVDTQ
ncbi:MAG: restriction endonuclease subunit S [Sulfuricella sp.]|nr:restriction endonuclease subunit S [Sulfuricella sp.]